MTDKTVAPDDAFDPFAVFDAMAGAGAVIDPYPGLAELRRSGSVHRGSVDELLGVEAFRLEDVCDPPAVFTVLGWDECVQVLRELPVSSRQYELSMGVVMGRSILQLDGPEHHRYRSLVQKAFSRRSLDVALEESIPPIANRLIDEWDEREPVDLIRSFAFRFPIFVIAELLGLPEEDLDRFSGWAAGLCLIGYDPINAMRCAELLREYFGVQLDAKRSHPSEDLLSSLAVAEIDGQRLTDDEILAFLCLLLPAGAETTYRSTGSLLVGLLSHPDQFDRLRQDPTLLPGAIEEGLRWEPPLTYIWRTASADFELAGHKVPKDAILDVCLGAANRDPARHDRPDEFNIFRADKSHLGFAHGAHVCLGMHLARLESATALRVLFDRAPRLRLDPANDPPRIDGLIFRSPKTLLALTR